MFVKLIENLIELSKRLLAEGGNQEEDKLSELISKLKSAQFNIAFCGHFSAGKSSLINKLCGHSLLPSSPIPTSANIVRISNGTPSAQVIGTGEGKVVSIALDELQEYCLISDNIKSIQLTYPIPMLNLNTSLLDTPGVDSAEQAHLLSTESVLHLADVVFYVMDYNYIQSAVNFRFAKQMKDWGKPLYLIVNQIDKHQDRELSFNDLKQQTEEVFREWNINPQGILYISLKEPDHAMDEYEKVQWLILELQKLRDELITANVFTAVRFLIDQHCARRATEREPSKDRYRKQLSEDLNATEAALEYQKISNQLQEVKQFPNVLISQLKKEIVSLIDNAHIMPALTRDLADHYLNSRKPGFKSGFLASTHKTNAEIQKRLTILYNDFNEKIIAHIDWYIRDILRKNCDTLKFPPDYLLSMLDQLQQEITAGWLAREVSSGAVFSNEYTMNYTRQVANLVKSMYRSRVNEIAELLALEAAKVAKIKELQLLESLEKLSKTTEAYQHLSEMEQEEANYAMSLRELIQIDPDGSQGIYLPELKKAPLKTRSAKSIKANSSKSIDQIMNSGTIPQTDASSYGNLAQETHHREEQNTVLEEMHKASARLLTAQTLINEIPSMRTLSQSMLDKAGRLNNQTFTISLFGAFSAGKSSFANALLGENVLPVSPNPTTAAINKIVCPQEGWPHGTAKVIIKGRNSLIKDVNYSLGALGIHSSSFEESLSLIPSLSVRQISGSGKPHVAFLKSIALGWKVNEGLLGRELKVDMEGFRKYAADEVMSCFVEHIELYYSSPLTDQGIILVDTPGADSINARHTGVAFNYIKDADAILFVTYYNHAFSQADREFLLQLGRVKDSFTMDKMFFLINAADLANSEAELQQVVKHLADNLSVHGIRHPRIFSLSSSQAIQGKQMKNRQLLERSGLLQFEQQFNKFIYEELALIAVNSAQHDIERSITYVEQWMDTMQQDESIQEERKGQLALSCRRLVALINNRIANLETAALEQEINELLFYIKQRLFFRYGDFYNMAFNPAELQDDGRDIKTALRSAWFELLRLVSYDLSQELWAATLRIEKYMNRSIQKIDYETSEEISLEINGFKADEYYNQRFVTPELVDVTLNPQMNERLINSYFKSARSFFEGGGKAKLKDELEKQLIETVVSILTHQTIFLTEYYSHQYITRTRHLLEQQKQLIEEHDEGINAILNIKSSSLDMQSKLRKLKGLVG